MAVPPNKEDDEMKTLYASDLDGTLLGSDARLSAETTKMLNELKRRGVDVTFVTARTPATVQPIMRDALPRVPGVVMTGAALWLPTERRYASVKYHTEGDAALIMELCRRHGVTPFVYTLPVGGNSLSVYHEADRLTDVENRFVKDRTLNDLKSFYLYTPLPEDKHSIIVLFFAMGEPDKIRAVAEDIRSHTSCYASWYPDTYNPGLSLLEVFTAGVSKAEGLNELKSQTGADRVVAFGDNLNDIPMLQAADVAIAVENAHPEVKAHADIVIGPNTSDSVAKFITSAEL